MSNKRQKTTTNRFPSTLRELACELLRVPDVASVAREHKEEGKKKLVRRYNEAAVIARIVQGYTTQGVVDVSNQQDWDNKLCHNQHPLLICWRVPFSCIHKLPYNSHQIFDVSTKSRVVQMIILCKC
jgi:hypothetical protein